MVTESTDGYDERADQGWVLYDADCTLCLDLLARSRRALEAGGFLPEPLQSPWVRDRLNLPEAALLAEMRVLTAHGQVIGGADGIVHIARALAPRQRPWWGWVILILNRLPLGKRLLRSTYAWVAKHRHCRPGACKIPRTQIPHKEVRR